MFLVKFIISKLSGNNFYLKLIYKILILRIKFKRNFKDHKLKNENKISKANGDVHVNYKSEAKKVQFLESINIFFNDYENFTLEYNKKKYKSFQLSNQFFRKKNYKIFKNKNFIYIYLYNIIKELQNRDIQISYLFVFIHYGISNHLENFFKKINKSKSLENYIFSANLLRNLTHVKFLKNKESFVKNFVKKYPDKYSLRLALSATEYNLANKNLLQTLHKNFDNKIKTCCVKPKNYIGLSLYAFGHMLLFIDFFHRNKRGILNKKILVNKNYISNLCLWDYINYKYKKKIVEHKHFYKNLFYNRFNFYDVNTDIFGKSDSVYFLAFEEYLKNKKISASIDYKILSKIFKEKKFKKLKVNSKFICLFHRELNFKKQNLDKNQLDADRTVELNNYTNLIKFFIFKGYKIIIMGSSSQNNLKYQHKNLIMYPKSIYKNDYNDIKLIMDCDFLLNFGQSGFSNLSMCFDKYSLNLEFPFNRKPFFNEKSYFSIRPLYKKGVKMRYQNYFDKDLYQVHDFEILKSKGYSLGATSSKELIEISKNFLNVINKKNNKFVKSSGIDIRGKKNYYNIWHKDISL